MQRPKLAVDASRAQVYGKTGTEWYSTELIPALAGIRPRPRLVLYGRQPLAVAHLDEQDTQCVISLSSMWTHFGLSAAMVRDRPNALFVPSHVIPALHPRSSVVTVHDLGYKHEPDAHPRSSRVMLDLTTRWNAHVARRVIAISEQTRSDLIDQSSSARLKTSVIHSGLNHSRFRPTNPDAVLVTYGLKQPYVLFLSTVQPRKNVVRLVEAFEAIDRSDLHLVVAGKSGWLSDDIEARLQASPSKDRIIRLGFIPDEHVPHLYSGAAAFALPSLYEGFGMGILEAMACGCPVVTSNRSSMPEIAAEAGVLVDPSDVTSIRAGLERALSTTERETLIRDGLYRASQFTWERTAEQTLAVIKAAMSG